MFVDKPNIEISIHALRVEGDWHLSLYSTIAKISIHALRVEGDSKNAQLLTGIFGNIHKLIPTSYSIPHLTGKSQTKYVRFCRNSGCEPPGFLWALPLRTQIIRVSSGI